MELIHFMILPSIKIELEEFTLICTGKETSLV